MAVSDVPSEGGSILERIGCDAVSHSLGRDTGHGIYGNPARKRFRKTIQN
jgi:hypothetical protein